MSCRLLIEWYGYQTTFLVTAGIKSISFLPMICLLPYVSDGICAGGRARAAMTAAAGAAASPLEAGYEQLPQGEEEVGRSGGGGVGEAVAAPEQNGGADSLADADGAAPAPAEVKADAAS